MDPISFQLLSHRIVSTQETAQSYILFPFRLSKPFFERHECFGTRRNLFLTTFVCYFHLHKVVVIIVFIAMKSFHCISIFTVSLLSLPASQGSTRFRSCFCFSTSVTVVAFPTPCTFANSLALTSFEFFDRVVSFVANFYNWNSLDRIKKRVHSAYER